MSSCIMYSDWKKRPILTNISKDINFILIGDIITRLLINICRIFFFKCGGQINFMPVKHSCDFSGVRFSSFDEGNRGFLSQSLVLGSRNQTNLKQKLFVQSMPLLTAWSALQTFEQKTLQWKSETEKGFIFQIQTLENKCELTCNYACLNRSNNVLLMNAR